MNVNEINEKEVQETPTEEVVDETTQPVESSKEEQKEEVEETVVEEKEEKKKGFFNFGSSNSGKKSTKTDKHIHELEEKMATLTAEKEELRDKYLRLLAEFDNYKKRTSKERMELFKTAGRETIEALLPVLDDFHRAKKLDEDDKSTESFTEGVQLVYEKLQQTMARLGLEAMKTNGEPFDPEIHEAITEIPAPTEEMKGKIIDTIEGGYKLKDKIIRYAKVVVGK